MTCSNRPRWHGLEPGPYAVLRTFSQEPWDELVSTILQRRTDERDGPSPLMLHRELHGIRPPSSLPHVVWRGGVDLDPIDPRDPDARPWLETPVWPEEDDRLARLRMAFDLAAADPVRILRSDPGRVPPRRHCLTRRRRAAAVP